MSSEWKIAPLGEIARNVSRAFNFKNKDKVVFVNTGDVLNGDFLHFNKSNVKGLPGQAKKAIENKDILYSEIRPGNKRYVFVNDCFTNDIVVSTKFMVLEAKGPVIPEYLYLVLTSQECESEFKIIADSRSGTFPQITFDSVSHYPIKYPFKSIQKKIFEFDGALTGRIKINNDINQTLEEMAKALFKSWFVDFEPVKAKIAALEEGSSQEDATLAAMTTISGKDADALTFFEREHPEQYAELKATAELFPSAMQESELGEIPEGWELKSFGDVSKCYDKKRIPLSKPQREKKKGEIPYYGATSIMDYVDEYIFDGIYLLLGEDGSVIKENGLPFTQYIWGKSWVNNHAHVLTGSGSVTTEHLMVFIKQENIAAYVTGAVQMKLNQKNMNSIPFIFADEAVNNVFGQRIDSIYAVIRAKSEENLTLTNLRDTLLPKLLSGEITLPEAEQIISEEA
jgi:type I restriction enzyme S subunit